MKGDDLYFHPSSGWVLEAGLGAEPPAALRVRDHGRTQARHPRPPAFSDPQGLEPEAVDPGLPAVERRAGDAHLATGSRHLAELPGQRETAQANPNSTS